MKLLIYKWVLFFACLGISYAITLFSFQVSNTSRSFSGQNSVQLASSLEARAIIEENVPTSQVEIAIHDRNSAIAFLKSLENFEFSEALEQAVILATSFIAIDDPDLPRIVQSILYVPWQDLIWSKVVLNTEDSVLMNSISYLSKLGLFDRSIITEAVVNKGLSGDPDSLATALADIGRPDIYEYALEIQLRKSLNDGIEYLNRIPKHMPDASLLRHRFLQMAVRDYPGVDSLKAAINASRESGEGLIWIGSFFRSIPATLTENQLTEMRELILTLPTLERAEAERNFLPHPID